MFESTEMITAQQARELIGDYLAPDSLILMDKGYSLPAKDWITGEFAAAWRADLKLIGADKYVPESNDCDKFSLGAAFIAHLCNMRTQTGRSMAFGFMLYTRDSDGIGHAINIAITGTAAAPQLLFFEPQDQQQVSLSEAERMSCEAVVM